MDQFLSIFALAHVAGGAGDLDVLALQRCHGPVHVGLAPAAHHHVGPPPAQRHSRSETNPTRGAATQPGVGPNNPLVKRTIFAVMN